MVLALARAGSPTINKFRSVGVDVTRQGTSRPAPGELPREPVFIVSTGRTGTKAIAQYLRDGFGGVHAVHEPGPSVVIRLAVNARVSGRLTARGLMRLLYWLHRGAAPPDRRYVESNPYLYGCVDLLPRVFEAPRLVHLVRDPRTYVRSAINSGTFRGLRGAMAAFLPFWTLDPPTSRVGFSRQMPLEYLCWGWSFVNQQIEKGAPAYGERYLRIRFEDLFQAGGGGVREFANWLGLREHPGRLPELMRHQVNASSLDVCPPWDAWNEDSRRVLLDHCADRMRAYGYLE